jgi:trk system potassium uptake protein TrkH
MERENVLVGMDPGEKFLACFFSAVTPRTAGFNSVDTASLTDGSKFLTAVLMFIGGSPGSTAGGIKTSTVAVLLLCVYANIRQTHGVEVFGRRLEDVAVRQAAGILTINMSLMIGATIFIMVSQNLPMSDVFFETCSAMGTAGMSTGITRALGTFPRLVLILLMYCGRIGSLSFALAFTRSKRKPQVQLPTERITIG